MSRTVRAEAGAPALDFDAFFRSQYPGLVRLAWVLLRDRAAAEEASQEALLAAHRRWSAVVALDSPEAWVRRVLINRCTSMLRRLSLERRRSTRTVEGIVDIDVLPDPDLWAATARLPRRQAQAVALVYVADLSPADAAAAMGCATDTLRTHLRRALARLAKELTDSEEVTEK